VAEVALQLLFWLRMVVGVWFGLFVPKFFVSFLFWDIQEVEGVGA
jgi:hypothetical protein